ncbi:MAG: hypothetical protein M3020_26705 [Myxococcota bacterium]|nr:hypothetical protein [Myxococcota bacterium]
MKIIAQVIGDLQIPRIESLVADGPFEGPYHFLTLDGVAALRQELPGAQFVPYGIRRATGADGGCTSVHLLDQIAQPRVLRALQQVAAGGIEEGSSFCGCRRYTIVATPFGCLCRCQTSNACAT